MVHMRQLPPTTTSNRRPTYPPQTSNLTQAHTRSVMSDSTTAATTTRTAYRLAVWRVFVRRRRPERRAQPIPYPDTVRSMHRIERMRRITERAVQPVRAVPPH